MDHVENVGIEEIDEIIREFAKHGEEVVDREFAKHSEEVVDHEFAKHGEEVIDKEKLQLRRVVMKW